MSLPLASGPSPYWYATRGAGIVALLLLTASLVMGVVDLSRWQTERSPRFVVDGIHRTLSLLAVVVVAVHVVTTVVDSFTQIGLKDAVIPFVSPYRALWLGFGTLAFDLLLALTITSVLRRWIGHRAWRAVHWAAYACWPLAVLHGLGSGTDTPVAWMLVVTAACVIAVTAAVGWRVANAWPGDEGRLTLAAAAGATVLLALVLWVAKGPLGSNWASRAGTPSPLLASVGAAPGATGASAAELSLPFSSSLAGSVRQHAVAGNLVDLDIRGTLADAGGASLEIQIEGQPLAGGGVAMTASRVTLGPRQNPGLYGGNVTQLGGTQVLARVSDGSSPAQLDVNLSLDQATGRVTGKITATPVSGGTS